MKKKQNHSFFIGILAACMPSFIFIVEGEASVTSKKPKTVAQNVARVKKMKHKKALEKLKWTRMTADGDFVDADTANDTNTNASELRGGKTGGGYGRPDAMRKKQEQEKKAVIQDRIVGEIRPLEPPSPHWTKVEYVIDRGAIEEIVFDADARGLEVYVCQTTQESEKNNIKIDLMYKVDPFSKDNSKNLLNETRPDIKKNVIKRHVRYKKDTVQKENVNMLSKDDVNAIENTAFLADDGRVLAFKNLAQRGDPNFPFRINVLMPSGVEFTPYSKSIFLRGNIKLSEKIQETSIAPQGTSQYHQEAPTAKTSKKKDFFGLF